MMIVSHKKSGFTLMEVLLATVIFSTLLAALYGVFLGTFKLRERTYEAVENGIPRTFIINKLKADLQSMAAPSGTLAGLMVGENEENTEGHNDTLDFHTLSGRISESESWGDIQRVIYELSDEEVEDEAQGKNLVRIVYRNLLETVSEEPEGDVLLTGVASLEFQYFDGEDWQDSWESEDEEDVAPEAVMMQIRFIEPEDGSPADLPISVVCEISIKAQVEEEQGNANAG